MNPSSERSPCDRRRSICRAANELSATIWQVLTTPGTPNDRTTLSRRLAGFPPMLRGTHSINDRLARKL